MTISKESLNTVNGIQIADAATVGTEEDYVSIQQDNDIILIRKKNLESFIQHLQVFQTYLKIGDES